MTFTNNKLKRSFYKWHRILGLTALVPIISWTISGLSHPLMSNWFRPFIPHEVYVSPTLDQLKPALSLTQVLDTNHITRFRNFGIIKLNGQTCYQILQQDSSNSYYAANTGRLLSDGDRQYAIQLARYFTQDSISAIKSITLQKSFDANYQPINHLLPVWKVSFNRTDGMDIYVETGQNRLATFNNNTRKFFLNLFEQMHTWDFLAAIAGDQIRLITLFVIVSIMFLALISGLIVYGLFWNRFREIAQKRKGKKLQGKHWLHRYHRQLGLSVSFLMLMTFMSAGFHLLVKLHNIKTSHDAAFEQIISTNQLKTDNLHLPVADSLTTKQALIKFNNNIYYQLLTSTKQLVYVDAANGTILPAGDKHFAAYLAGFYSDKTSHNENPEITSVKQFTTEYGFINKRLPVEKVSYKDKDDWYLETTTAKLATHVAGIDRAEGFSFIFLHKYFWLTWAGKDIRDAVSMLVVLCILMVAILGFTAFIKNK